MVLEAGGEVVRAPEVVHGKASLLEHDGTGPFAGVPNPVKIGRYHSLCTPNPPPRFRVHAAIDRMAMAISDAEAKQVGVQFHPESVLTPVGQSILANVLDGFGRA
jgi:anthranilate synthase component 2